MNRNLAAAALLPLLSLVLIFTGCQPKVTQAELLNGISRDIIYPLYQDAADQAAELAKDADSYQKEPTPDKLALLGKAWKNAAMAWQRTEPYRLGPATDLWLSNKIGYQNIRVATIEGNAAKVGTPEELKLSAVGASGKGLFAVGYLLFQPGGAPKTPTAQQRVYAAQACADTALLTAQLADAWSPTGKNYAKTFADGGQGSLNKMINGMIESIERLKEKRLARLLGREAVWGDDTDVPSKTDPSMTLDGDILAAPLEGAEALFSKSSAPHEPSLLMTYLNQTGSQIGLEFQLQIHRCIEMTKTLPAPLNAPSSRPALDADYLEVKKLVGLAKSSLISSLGVTLTFNSNDGD